MSHELVVLLASTMSKQQIVDRMKESISEYEEAHLLNKTPDEIKIAEHGIMLSCHLYIMNDVTKGSIQGAVETLGEIKTMQQRNKIFDVKDSTN